jgi:hypothetical protein
LGVGLTARVLDESPRIHPELIAAAEVHLVATTTTGTGEDVQATPATEIGLRPGARLGAGVGIDAGPGQVLIQVAGGWVPQDGTLTGNVPGWLFLPSFGYRVHK